MNLSPELLTRIESSVDLPSPSHVAVELLGLCRKRSSGVEDFVRCLEMDPALTGRLIQYANASAGESFSQVTTVRDAILQLGLRNVQRIVLGLSLIAKYSTGQCRDFDYTGFWARAFMTAVTARYISERIQSEHGDEMFVLGLLGDIGQLALSAIYPKKYGQILQQSLSRTSLLETERDSFDIDQEGFTRVLLDAWGFSEKMINALFPLPESDSTASDILTMARVIAESSMEDGCIPEDLESLLAVAERLGFETGNLDALMQTLHRRYQEWSRLFGLPDLPPALCSDDLSVERIQAHEQQSADAQASGLLILVADDDILTLKRVEKLLSNGSDRVIFAENGRQALELAIQHKPHLLISDWRMPGMNGPELCRAIREIRAISQCYILMLTSCETDDEIVEAFHAGADDYLVKPFCARVLQARIRSGRRLMQQQMEIERDRETIREIAEELSVTNQKLKRMALNDPLTDLPNRRFAMNLMKQFWTERTAHSDRISCIMVDIDNFKSINDTYGHDFGDVVLQVVARRLNNNLRVDDVVCRLGGEEFLVICANGEPASSRQLGLRLCESVAQTPVIHDETSISVTVSLGLATQTGEMKDYSALIKHADNALYAAKRSGKNRLSVAAG